MWSFSIFAQRAVVLISGLLLVGCGFQVRGAVEFPQQMSVVYVDTADRFTPFYKELTTVFGKSGLTVTRSPTDADTVFRITRDETGQRVLSVSARNVPVEYDVFYKIQYSVYIDDAEVLPPQDLARNRDYTYEATEILGKAQEEAVLRDSLAAELVALVTRQMGSIN